MRTGQKLRNLLHTALFTVTDELHYRSFYILTIISVLFVFMLRGCFSSDMFVNWQRVDSVTMGWHASLWAFHLISAAGVLIAVLLSMRVFRRDRENGMAVSVLSKPVSRIQYVSGKIAGIFLLSYGFTFILHFSVYLIMLFNTGGHITWFLPASMIVALNIFFAVVSVSFFTFLMPDVIAALLGIGIAVISFAMDSFYALAQSQAARSIIGMQEEIKTSLWVKLWPKLTALQYYATSLIQDTVFRSSSPVHPALNVALYSAIFYLFLVWRFDREEIS